MEQALKMRESMIYFYKKYEGAVNFIIKFLIGFFVFHKLSLLSSGAISGASGMMVGLGGGFVTAVLPPTGFFILAMLGTGLFLSFSSIELAICAMILFFLIIVFYSRIFPKESLLIPAMLIAYYFKVPYVIPVFAGIYVGFIGIVPIITGSFLWGMIPFLPVLAEAAPKSAFTPLSMPDHFIQVYVTFLEIAVKNKEWIFTAVIFSFTVLLTAILAHLSIQYAKQIAAVTAGMIMVFSFLGMLLFGKVEVSILWLLIGNGLSVFLILVVCFFEMVLDYPNSERVEFEDQDYYYYVKIVPKLTVMEYSSISETTGKKKRQSKTGMMESYDKD